jgi:hypothetical protein
MPPFQAFDKENASSRPQIKNKRIRSLIIERPRAIQANACINAILIGRSAILRQMLHFLTKREMSFFITFFIKQIIYLSLK